MLKCKVSNYSELMIRLVKYCKVALLCCGIYVCWSVAGKNGKAFKFPIDSFARMVREGLGCTESQTLKLKLHLLILNPHSFHVLNSSKLTQKSCTYLPDSSLVFAFSLQPIVYLRSSVWFLSMNVQLYRQIKLSEKTKTLKLCMV